MQDAGGFFQAIVVILSSVFGVGGFCFLLSLALKNRWVAGILMYVLFLLVIALPEVGRAPLMMATGPPAATVNLYYLNPVQALIQMAEPTAYYLNSTLQSGVMLAGTQPMWKITSEIFFCLGLLSYLLSLLFVKQIAKSTEERPLEGAVAGL